MNRKEKREKRREKDYNNNAKNEKQKISHFFFSFKWKGPFRIT